MPPLSFFLVARLLLHGGHHVSLQVLLTLGFGAVNYAAKALCLFICRYQTLTRLVSLGLWSYCRLCWDSCPLFCFPLPCRCYHFTLKGEGNKLWAPWGCRVFPHLQRKFGFHLRGGGGGGGPMAALLLQPPLHPCRPSAHYFLPLQFTASTHHHLRLLKRIQMSTPMLCFV